MAERSHPEKQAELRRYTWKEYGACGPTSKGDFKDILKKSKSAGSDSNERPDKIKVVKMVSAAVFVMDRETKKTASIQMPVPGRQTIPRAKL